MPRLTVTQQIGAIAVSVAWASGYQIGGLEINQAFSCFLFTCIGGLIPYIASEEDSCWRSVPLALALGMAIYITSKFFEDPAAEWYGRFFVFGFICHLIMAELREISEPDNGSRWTDYKFWSKKNASKYALLYLSAFICWAGVIRS